MSQSPAPRPPCALPPGRSRALLIWVAAVLCPLLLSGSVRAVSGRGPDYAAGSKDFLLLDEQAGSFEGFGTPVVSVEDQLHSVDVPMRFQRLEITWRVSWDAEGAVAKF